MNQPEMQAALAERSRALLTRLPGVYAANVQFDDAGEVRELHVIASSARSPKQISRDVQSALLAAYALKVDHRVISIAQMPDNPLEAGPAPGADVRLKCSSLSSSSGGDRYEVSVLLTRGDRSYPGEAACRDTPSQRARAAAQAALNAVHASLAGEEPFQLLATQTVDVCGVSIAVTVMEYACAGTDRLLIGAARQGDDIAESYVRSALDALNRSFTKAAANLNF